MVQKVSIDYLSENRGYLIISKTPSAIGERNLESLLQGGTLVRRGPLGHPVPYRSIHYFSLNGIEVLI